MAATLDKDTLVKHSFWILAGIYVVLVLVSLAVLATSVRETVRKEQEDLTNAEKAVEGITDPKNEKYVEAYKTQDEFVDRKKKDVWSEAWETQKDMMTWPRELQTRFQKYKYFGDKIDPADRDRFDEKYASQFDEVWKVVQPVTANGEGAVQCKGDWGEVLRLSKNFVKKPPTSDDIWLTQEELWVKREMLRIIRDANESVARFKEVTPEASTEKDKQDVKAGPTAEKDGKPAKSETAAADKDQKGAKPVAAAPKTDPNHKIFRNPYWEFDLTLAGTDRGKYVLRGKVTNIGKRKQPLDTKFKVFLQDTGTEEPSFELVSLAALPLAVGESKNIEQPVPEQKTIGGLFGVEQVLNWRTAAVKRLDDLELMYPSSRVMRELKPPRFISTTPPETADSSTSGDTSAQTAGATTPSPGGPGSPYGGGLTQVTATLNGLEISRYMDVGDQVRHMPVAMVVIVDEEHLPELLAAFVNSKLRIQITQYHWQHCRERMNPLLNEPQFTPGGGSSSDRPYTASTRGGPGMMPGGKMVPYGGPGYGAGGRPLRGGGERSGQMPRGGLERVPSPGGPSSTGATRPFGPPSAGIGTSRPTGAGNISESEEEQEDLNLLEVAVYGLASLYERYPPAPKPVEQSPTDDKPPATSSTGGN